MAVCDSFSCCLSFFSSSGGWVVIDNDLATAFSPWLTSVWSTRRSLPQLPHCRRSAQAPQRDSPVLHLNSSGIIYSFHHCRLELFAPLPIVLPFSSHREKVPRHRGLETVTQLFWVGWFVSVLNHIGPFLLDTLLFPRRLGWVQVQSLLHAEIVSTSLHRACDISSLLC